jgi:hypothetical protein
MLYQYVKRYLKNTLKEPRIDLEWSTLDDIKFFNYIEQRYTLEEFSKEISEVKVAFKDFFEPIGNIVFRYKEESGIKFKIFPYKVKPQDSKHLKTIVKIINANKKHIKYPYQEQNDQIAILGKIRREVNRELFDTQESINKKELIKHALRVALHLGKKDIITQLKRKYIIKIFNKNTVLDVDEEVLAPTAREGKANRFNGYTAEQIEETYKEIFKRGNANIKYFLKAAMKNVFYNDLNFRVISNEFYEAKSLKIIHQFIAKELSDYIQLEDDYLLGISGYLMRKNFYQIHELMAIELIECIYEKNTNATNFLLFYNGKTILLENTKYIIPSLESEDGRKWNNSSLIGICNLWMNTKKRKESYEHKLEDTNTKLDEINKKLAYIQPEKELQETTIKEVEEQAKSVNIKNSELEAKYAYLEKASLNSTEYFTIKKELVTSNTKVKELENIIKEAKSNLNAIKDANMTTYAELEIFTNQKKQLLEDVRNQDLDINSKSTQINSIIQSIVKVLMDRTKLMKNG